MTVTGSGTSATVSTTIDVSDFGDGVTTLKVRVQDLAGNWSTISSTDLAVRSPIYYSTLGNTNPPGVAGTADDSDLYLWSGLAHSRSVDLSLAPYSVPTSANVDGLTRVDGTHFYLSFAADTTLPGVGAVQDEDVVYWNGSAWSVYFNGTAHGLTNANLDLDAISVKGSTLYFSTLGNTNPPGVGGTADDADIYSWNGTSYARVWDASANGVPAAANVDGYDRVDGTHFYLSFARGYVGHRGGDGPGRGCRVRRRRGAVGVLRRHRPRPDQRQPRRGRLRCPLTRRPTSVVPVPDPTRSGTRGGPTAGAQPVPVPRGGRRRRWVVLVAAAVAVGLLLTWAPWRKSDVRDGTTAVDRAGLSARHGIDVNLVAVTAAGGLVELRMQVTDPDKANLVVHDPADRPILVAEDTGQTLAMASPPHHKASPRARPGVLLPPRQRAQRVARGREGDGGRRRRTAGARRGPGMIVGGATGSRSTRLFAWLALGVALLATLLLLLPAPAQAHSGLVRSDPADGGSVAMGRTQLTLWYDEPIALAASRFRLATDGRPTRPTGRHQRSRPPHGVRPA